MEASHKTHRPHIKAGKDEEKKIWCDRSAVLSIGVLSFAHHGRLIRGPDPLFVPNIFFNVAVSDLSKTKINNRCQFN